MKRLELTGQRFGRLLVESKAGISDHGDLLWLAICDCGVRKTYPGSALAKKKSGTISCGCAKRERFSEVGKKAVRHGHCRLGSQRPKLYSSWCGMNARCHSPSDKSFPNYGGRGIKVCERWRGKEGFANFIADLGERPDGMTLDRIDVNGNYEPSNCKWATVKEQNANTRRKRIEQFSEKDFIKEYSRRFPEPEYGLSMC